MVEMIHGTWCNPLIQNRPSSYRRCSYLYIAHRRWDQDYELGLWPSASPMTKCKSFLGLSSAYFPPSMQRCAFRLYAPRNILGSLPYSAERKDFQQPGVPLLSFVLDALGSPGRQMGKLSIPLSESPSSRSVHRAKTYIYRALHH